MLTKPNTSTTDAAGAEDLLLEREPELERLDGALRRARAGTGVLVWVEGAPGTGRSRLLEAAATRAQRAGMRVLRAAGRDLERPFPFGVVVQLFERHLRALAPEDRAWVLDGPAREAEELFERPAQRGPGERFELIHGLLWLTRRLAEPSDGANSLALLVDDADQADAPSLRFLAYLAARIHELPVAVVLTCARAAAGHGEPLLAALRQDAAEVLAPAELSPAAVERLARIRLAPAADGRLAQACVRATAGNPFLVMAVLDEAQRTGLDLGAPGRAGIEELMPQAVLTRVRARLAGLAPEAATLAAAVLALGGEASLGSAAHLAQLEVQDAARAAEMLIERGLLAPATPLSFPAPLVARAVERAVGGVRRELLRERAVARAAPSSSLVADAVRSSRRGESRQRVAELVALAWDDGAVLDGAAVDGSPAAQLAEALVAVDDLERALRILAFPRDGAAEHHDYPARTADGYWRAWSLYHQGLIARALAAAESAAGTAGEVSAVDPGLSGAIAAARLQLGQLDRADAALRVLEAPAALPERMLAVLLDVRAQLRLAQNRPAEALVDALEAGRRSHSQADGAPPGIVAWRSTAALARLALGEPREARRLAVEELELARASGATRVIVRCLRAMGLAQGARGLDLLGEAVAAGADGPVRLEYLNALVDLGAATRRANRRVAAQEPLRRALELSRQRGAATLARRAQLELAAASGRKVGSHATGMEALTPSERRVAVLAAGGSTTRQIAGELFVTPKAVEFHLRHIYRKLGIRSTRAELARAVQAEIGPP